MQITDESGTPWVTIRVSCAACGAQISVSRLSALRGGRALDAAARDATAAREHLRTCARRGGESHEGDRAGGGGTA